MVLLDFLGFDISGWIAGTGAVAMAGMLVTFLRKKGYIKGVKLFSRKLSHITKEIGEAFLDTSDVLDKVDIAIKEDGTLKENCVKDIITAGKEALIEWEDVVLVIKPKKK